MLSCCCSEEHDNEEHWKDNKVDKLGNDKEVDKVGNDNENIKDGQRLLNDDNRKRKREMDDLSIELSKPKKRNS